MEKRNLIYIWFATITITLSLIFHVSLVEFNVNDNILLILISNLSRYKVITSILVLLIFNYVRSNINNIKKDWSLSFPAGLFSVFTLIGDCFKNLGEINFIFYNNNFIILSLFSLIGYYFIWREAIRLFWLIILRNPKKLLSLELLVFEKHPVLITSFIILLCWIPYFIIFYPGAITYDGFNQINQFEGIIPLNNHHPVVSTFLIGICFNIGQFFGNDNLGIFIYTFGQAIALAFTFGLTFLVMKNLNSPIYWRIFILCFYSFFTEWPTFAQTVIKDTMYTIFIMLFCIQLAFYMQKNIYTVKRNVLFMLTILFILLLRKNGIHIIVLTFFVIMLIPWDEKKHLLRLIILPLFLFLIISKIILPFYNIPPGKAQEMLSIPLQQTARYAIEFEEEITSEEKEAINKVVVFDKLKEAYNPEISDPVKDLYRDSVTGKELKNYFKIWFKQLIKHPMTYISATLHNTYGYYSLEVDTKGFEDKYSICSNPSVNTGHLNIYFASPLYSFGANKLRELRNIFEATPIIGLLYNLGIYTWILICVLLKIVKLRAYKWLGVLMPSIVTILICIASPVNAYYSYMLPVMALTPILVSIAINIIQTEKNAKLKS